MARKGKVEDVVEEVKMGVEDEISLEEFEKLSEKGGVDYEEVWKRVEGRILSSKGLEKVVNEVRGFERQLYWSERKRILDQWRRKGRVIEEKLGIVFVNGRRRRMKFYKFGAEE